MSSQREQFLKLMSQAGAIQKAAHMSGDQMSAREAIKRAKEEAGQEQAQQST